MLCFLRLRVICTISVGWNVHDFLLLFTQTHKVFLHSKCVFCFNMPSAKAFRLSFCSRRLIYLISSVQSLSRVRLFATSWIAARQASLSITNSRSSLKVMSIELVMPSSHIILYRPLLLLPPTPPSIRVFPNESLLRMRWPKYWSFSFSIIPSKEHPGLMSFRMDQLDLLAVLGTLKSLLQHHSSKASIFGTQLSSESNSHIHTWLLEKP